MMIDFLLDGQYSSVELRQRVKKWIITEVHPKSR